jgi:hypothetical protein
VQRKAAAPVMRCTATDPQVKKKKARLPTRSLSSVILLLNKKKKKKKRREKKIGHVASRVCMQDGAPSQKEQHRTHPQNQK